MFIINKVKVVTTPASLVATNDADINTGITGATWGGCNPSDVGATGNAATGNGLTNIVSSTVFDETAIAKLVQVNITSTLTAGQINYVRIPFSSIQMSENKTVLGGICIGAYNINATENNNTPTPSLFNINSGLSFVAIVKDAVILKIPSANIALFQNKTINLLLIYG